MGTGMRHAANDRSDTEDRKRTITRGGLVLSAALAVAITIVLFPIIDSSTDMKLNEWGDFFAGVFSPFAFLWLVVGYFQHGEQLRLNSKELHLQYVELRRQVDETRNLVDAAKSELRFQEEREARAASPVFIFRGGGNSEREAKHDLHNFGAGVRDVEFSCDQDVQTSSGERFMGTGSTTDLRIVPEGNAFLQFPLVFWN